MTERDVSERGDASFFGASPRLHAGAKRSGEYGVRIDSVGHTHEGT